MIKIYNQADNIEIDVTGAIGADWFGEGNTRETVLNQIKEADVQDITVNVKSLGGDAFEAFAIYDMLKEHKARITTKIVGATASAGTIIAMAGDDVQITENSKFLIHNASTLTLGNAKEHEKSAEMLNGVDDTIVNIYRKKTGQNKSKIKSLMAEEKWIDAAEAKDFGFVDKVIKTTNKVENYAEISKILNISEMDTTLIKSLLGVEKDSEIDAALQTVINERDALKAEAETLTGGLADLQEQFNAVNDELQQEKETKILALVQAAIDNGKIKAEAKDIYMNLLKSDFENGVEVLNSIEAKPVTMKDVAGGIKPETAEKKDFKWYVENDLEGLYTLAKTNPEKYQQIIKTR